MALDSEILEMCLGTSDLRMLYRKEFGDELAE
jgi:hypothetical protein